LKQGESGRQKQLTEIQEAPKTVCCDEETKNVPSSSSINEKGNGRTPPLRGVVGFVGCRLKQLGENQADERSLGSGKKR